MASTMPRPDDALQRTRHGTGHLTRPPGNIGQRVLAWFSPRFLWLPILAGSLLAVSLYFVSERTGAKWREFRGSRAALPLSSLERLYQFNIDQPGWLALIRNFPAYYAEDNYRIDRPGYPALVSGLAWIGHGLAVLLPGRGKSATPELSLTEAIVSGLVVNWLLYASSIFGFYHLLQSWQCDREVAGLAAVQLALSPFLIWALLPISTNLVAFPIALAALGLMSWSNSAKGTVDEYSRGACLGAALGLMVLTKAQYDVFLTGWLVLAGLRRWRVVLTSCLVHALVIGGWIVFVGLQGWVFTSPEVGLHRQGVWIWEEFARWRPGQQAAYSWTFVREYSTDLWLAFGPVVLAALAVGVYLLFSRGATRLLGMLGVTVAFNALAVFAIRRHYPVYVAEMFFAVFPVAAWGLWQGVRRVGGARRFALWWGYVFASSLIMWTVYWVPEFRLRW
jgi:hypothetical protein